MKTTYVSALILAVLTLAGCGSMGLENKTVDYKSAAETKATSLEVPPDLTTPTTADHYAIPGEDESVANYSDYAKNGGMLPAKTSSVLPESRNVHLEQNGTQRWLVVEDTAENVWPVVKTFWSENGFVIKTDNPQAGLIETDWAENRAKIPKGGLRSLLGKVFDDLYDSGERDMYSTRLERGADNKSTRIYISHYGKVEVQSADKTTFQWVPRDHNPELEATMLQLLMTKLGGTAAQAEAQAATAQAQAVAAQSAPPAPKLQTSATGTETILLGEPFDKSWHKVGQALEHAGLNIEDRDRANGIYYLNAAPAAKEKSWFSKLAFWSKDDTKPLRYQVTVHEEDAGCTVAVNNGNGESNADTQRIVDTLYKALSAQ